MKYSNFIVAILASILFINCSKKDLPQPNQLNAYNRNIYQQGNGSSQQTTAPCASSLQNNKASYTYSPDGTSMAFTPSVNTYSNFISIYCSDYSTYNYLYLYIPPKGSFIGKVTYDVQPTFTTSGTVASLSHVYNSYYLGYTSYSGYEGTIYAEYTPTKIILSFCSVKVKDQNSSIHEVTGQVVIPNNN